uniref:Uncharacterized protein n=1 Tax=Caloglossa intermedia TaxID=100879 RepID=A0A1Z1M683_9FLOR|nr:hypothetical protein [Caloglossa intermedia]ARW61440.1 hypothetical protein [Caloglossa intermedia]
MNLSHLSLHSQYLKTPITVFHKTCVKYKLTFIFTALFLVPYFSYKYIALLYLISILIYYCELKKKIKRSKFSLSWTSILICLNILIYIINCPKSHFKTFFKQAYFRLPIGIIEKYFFYQKNDYFYISIKYTNYPIPVVFVKTFLITLLHILLNKILLLSTQCELIILNFLNLLHKIYLNSSRQKTNFILAVLLTSQFLERFMSNIHVLHVSIRLKYRDFMQINIYTVYAIFYTFITSIKYDTYRLSHNMWNKKKTVKYFIY